MGAFGNYNFGNYNSGDYNSGDCNSGDCNSGDYNSGDYNSGDCNSDDGNSDDYNSDDGNSDDGNSGDYNSGNCNSGDYNSGDCNSGSYNSGSYNSGSYNSGSYNSGDYNSGDLNTDTPTVRLFNKETTIEFGSVRHLEYRNILAKYSKPLCEWIPISNMTEQEKKENPASETTLGYLKVNGICATDERVSLEDEATLRALPNFDENILKQCTGIDLSKKTVKIAVDGKEIQISRECFEQIKAQFMK